MADREKEQKALQNAEKTAGDTSTQPKSSLFSQVEAPKMQPIASIEGTPRSTPTQAAPGPAGQPVPPAQQPQPVRWTFNETGATTRQANFFAASLGLTEALFSFGNIARDGSATVNIDTKIVMSIYNAKRVLRTLEQLIAQYEERYGRIDIG